MLLALDGSPRRSSAGENQASACSTAETMLRCVSTAPLDSPVVPPVYCKNAVESSVAALGTSARPVPWARASAKRVTFCAPLKASV